MEAQVEEFGIDNSATQEEFVAGEELVTREEQEAELLRLVADSEFHCSERNKRFLQYISEKLFEGQEATIKAYSVAVDVFGRPANFDPAIDPIVRIEATRLRASLERYYEIYSHRTKVRISLPTGRYVPDFIRCSSTDETLEAQALSISTSSDPRRQAHPILNKLYPDARMRFGAIMLVGIGLLVMGAFFLLQSYLNLNGADSDTFSEQPTVSIDLMPAEGKVDGSAAQLRDALIIALERFQTLRILSPGTDEGAEQKQSASSGKAKYRVTLKYHGGTSLLWWRLVDLDTNEILKSGIERAPTGVQNWADPSNPLVVQLAPLLAGVTGIINDAESSATAAQTPLGNGCVLQAYRAIEFDDRHALESSRSCLQRTIELRPRDADAKAALAVALLGLSAPSACQDLCQRALDLSDHAAMATPYSAANAYAQMVARYAAGDVDGAVVAGQRALDLNPYDMKTAAGLGKILILAGRRNEAIPLLVEASRTGGRAANDATAMLTFDSYQRGAYDEALQRLQRSIMPDCDVLQLLKIAALGQSGRSSEAIQLVDTIRKSCPKFDMGVSNTIVTDSVLPPMANALREGLKMAGLDLR